MTYVLQDNLHVDSSLWIPNISPDVNSQMSIDFRPQNTPDGKLLVTNVGNDKMDGGLVSRKLQIPQFVGAKGQPTFLPYAKLRKLIMLPGMTAKNIARLETDGIFVFNSGSTAPANDPTKWPLNKFNCSTQWNRDTGQFEIDASPGASHWFPIGAGPSDLTPDVWHELILNFFFDFANNKRSVLSIIWDGTVYSVPSNLQGITAQPSNWGQVSSIQLQNEMVNPGVSLTIYDQISLAWNSVQF